MSKHQDSQIFGTNLRNIGNFPPLKVVVRGSEKQLRVPEHLNELT